MTPDDPRHGSYVGYSKYDCRCYPCRLAGRAWVADYYADQQAGRARLVDSTPAREHFTTWAAATGYGRNRFARLAGISLRAVTRIIDAPEPPRIRRHTLDAFLAVTVTDTPVPPTNCVPAEPYRRRAQALAAIGYGLSEQSRRMGLSHCALRASINRDIITRDVADRIVTLYDELHMRPVTGTHAAMQARRHAARKGWQPPLAWDDIDHDAHPTGSGVDKRARVRGIDDAVVERLLAGDTTIESTADEKREAMRRWTAAGRPAATLSHIHGWRDGRYSTPNQDAA